MRIEVPFLPPISSSSNWRGNWYDKHPDAQIYKQSVFLCAVDVRNRLQRLPWQPGFPPFKKPLLTLTFVFPNKRVRDEDNLRARFKPGLDGLVAAGIIPSDAIGTLEVKPVKVEVDKERAPMTILELAEVV